MPVAVFVERYHTAPCLAYRSSWKHARRGSSMHACRGSRKEPMAGAALQECLLHG